MEIAYLAAANLLVAVLVIRMATKPTGSTAGWAIPILLVWAIINAIFLGYGLSL